VNRAIARDPDLSRARIEVEVRNAKVFLRGTAASRYEQERAMDLISNVTGVVALDNAIAISRLGRRLTDDELRSEIQQQLWWDPHLNEGDVTLAVRDGEVKITGIVPDWQKRDLVTRVAQDAGARTVTNQLRIARD
jgi:osmotically-inducible protein OsmY